MRNVSVLKLLSKNMKKSAMFLKEIFLEFFCSFFFIKKKKILEKYWKNLDFFFSCFKHSKGGLMRNSMIYWVDFLHFCQGNSSFKDNNKIFLLNEVMIISCFAVSPLIYNSRLEFFSFILFSNCQNLLLHLSKTWRIEKVFD